MAELLIRVVDRTNPDDATRDAVLAKRGDVIEVKEDGAFWSPRERTNPDWRILSLPNVPVATARILTAAELPSGPLDRTLKRIRARRVNVDGIVAGGWAAWLADGTRTQPIRSLMVSEAQFLNFVQTKAPLPDPTVIG